MGEHGEQAEKEEVPVIGATDRLGTFEPGCMEPHVHHAVVIARLDSNSPGDRADPSKLKPFIHILVTASTP